MHLCCLRLGWSKENITCGFMLVLLWHAGFGIPDDAWLRVGFNGMCNVGLWNSMMLRLRVRFNEMCLVGLYCDCGNEKGGCWILLMPDEDTPRSKCCLLTLVDLDILITKGAD